MCLQVNSYGIQVKAKAHTHTQHEICITANRNENENIIRMAYRVPSCMEPKQNEAKKKLIKYSYKQKW